MLQDGSDVFDLVEGVFQDPNQKQAARDEYLALKMEPKKQDFTDFLAEFMYITIKRMALGSNGLVKRPPQATAIHPTPNVSGGFLGVQRGTNQW